ncbi:hypothetical protein LIA77_02241 [Sarocladium implicatum]|nr:hypothetical protein LIA77_02241 [Sarocladium implicatum]
MADFEAQIREASAKNSELLRILADTDHAKPALQEQQRFIKDLEGEAAKIAKRLEQLAHKRKMELKDHEKYRDSNVRRFMYKATGQKDKFAQKAEKEEREYFDVLQEEQTTTSMQRNVQEQLKAARQARQELEQAAQRHDGAQQELDRLYHSIFAGPTPQFPEEDEKESVREQMLQAYQETQSRLAPEAHVAQLLGTAQPHIYSALNHIERALSHSRMDMFGGGAMSDMMERHELSQAQFLIQRAQMQVEQARQANPRIPPFPRIDINHGSILGDVLFDNIFTDMAFHDEIKRGRGEVDRFRLALERQMVSAEARVKDLEKELGRREADLESARLALQQERGRAFERYASGKTAADLPPAYEPVAPGSSSAPPPPVSDEVPSSAKGVDSKA